jgi:hypothetical protein
MNDEQRARRTEAQQRYRDKNKDKLNDTRKQIRQENKAIKTIKPPTPDIETLKTIKPVKQLPTQKTEPKQDQTKEKYVAYIKAFYKEYTGEILPDDAEIIKKINEKSYKSQITAKLFRPIINKNFDDIITKHFKTIHILYSILRGIRGMNDEEKRLYPIVQKSNASYQENRSNIEELKEGAVSKINFDENEILKNAELLQNNEDKILYCFTMLLHRRLFDLQHTIKIEDEAQITDEINTEINYILGDKWYINKTKNKVKIILDLSPPLMELINKIENNKYVLGRILDKSTLTFRFNKITMKIYNAVYSPNNIRHIFITKINSDDNATFKNLKSEAVKAGHSLNEQQNYIYKISK